MKLFACALALAITASPHAAPSGGKTQQLTSSDQVPEGLAKSEWQIIRAAYEAGRHAFAPSATGWQARNPGQQWTTTFDGRGFVIEPARDRSLVAADGTGGMVSEHRSSPGTLAVAATGDRSRAEGAAGWQWGLELKSYGFPGAERVVGGVPVVKAEGQRLTYDWDAAVQEWFVNDARGLEHGFTVKERPEAGRKGAEETRRRLFISFSPFPIFSSSHPPARHARHVAPARFRRCAGRGVSGRHRRDRAHLRRAESVGCGWESARLALRGGAGERCEFAGRGTRRALPADH